MAVWEALAGRKRLVHGSLRISTLGKPISDNLIVWPIRWRMKFSMRSKPIQCRTGGCWPMCHDCAVAPTSKPTTRDNLAISWHQHRSEGATITGYVLPGRLGMDLDSLGHISVHFLNCCISSSGFPNGCSFVTHSALRKKLPQKCWILASSRHVASRLAQSV